jgi:hypothetical protein
MSSWESLLERVGTAVTGGGGRIGSANATTVATAAAVASVAGGVVVVQMFTDSDPLGKCARFFKQLRAHVRCHD